ncbi:nucleotidyltransferase [uncultured Cetobacterium sp.]|uniref:nucleotidyltransferase n=1 Tax=uncultured Cetobacterium sp. TaxID=527638 RepID=UPI00260C2408|nr:nucleotidyltransferase [uncultured Cetobacterium sp.]
MDSKLKGVGVVVEYNPFHNGHKYHYEKAKAEGDVVIAIMSGDFVQRGEPAVVNRWERAEMALRNGVDIVVELPIFYSTQSAEIFSRGAVGILDKLKVKKIVFGSETGDIEKLLERGKLEEKEEFQENLRKELKKGQSYPTAYSKTLEILGINNTLNSNDILGVEYIKAIEFWKSSIVPVAIKREKAGYYSEDSVEGISSATGIRKRLEKNEDYKDVVPEATYNLLKNAYENGSIAKLEDFYPLIRHKILLDREKIFEIQDIEIGYSNKLFEVALKNRYYKEFFQELITKRFTIGRTQRMLIHILLGITKKDTEVVKNRVPYIRVLGFNKNGQEYLKQIKKDEDLIVLTSLKNIKKMMGDEDLKLLELNEVASKIYSMINNYEDKKIPLIFK